MEFEYLVGGAGSADVALYIDDFNKPKVLIEVKPFQHKDFAKKYPTKIFEYIRKAKVKYGIATNGKEWILYDNYRVRQEYKRASKLLSLNFVDFVDYSDVLRLFSKKGIKEGILDKFAKEYHDKFYDWRESKKKPRDSKYNESVLRLEFAKSFLKNIKSK